MEKKTDDFIEPKPVGSSSGLVYKIGSGLLGGVCGIASTGYTIVKSGSSLVYNNIPLTPWSKSNENDNVADSDITNKKSEVKSGWLCKRKDKSD